MRRSSTRTARCAAAAAAAAGFAGLPAGATAATPFTAGTGIDPEIAVAPAGTGHVAWKIDATPDRLGYCRVPAGATACDVTHALDLPAPQPSVGASLSPRSIQVFAGSDGSVVLVASCTGCGGNDAAPRAWRWTSTNGGQSFAAAVHIGTREIDGRGEWLPESSVFVGPRLNQLQAMGSPVPNPSQGVAISQAGYSHDPAVARVAGSPKLVAVATNLSAIQFAYYSGADTTANAINSQANWTSNQSLGSPEPDNDEPVLAGGRNGVALTYRATAGGERRVGVRMFDPIANTFGGPRYVEAAEDRGGELLTPDSSQDPAGRLHVVWNSPEGARDLRYAVSDTALGTFSAPATAATGELFVEPAVAAGSDGNGFAVWTAAVGAGPIRVVPLPPESSSSTGRVRTVRVRVRGVVFRLTSAADCIPAGTRLRARIRVKRSFFRRIRRVTFQIDRRRPVVRRRGRNRSSLVARLSTRGLKSGRHRLTAKVYVRGFRVPVRLRTRFTIC